MLPEKDRAWLEAVNAKIDRKIALVSERNKDKIPYTATDGVYDDRRSAGGGADDGINWWTNGFWAGILWLMYHETGEERYAEIARRSEGWLDRCFEAYYGLHHDVGFMWLPSAVADYRLTKNPDARRRGLHAANLLAGRFNPVGKFIRAWNENGGNDTRGWVIIDSMFNIPLLYWAYDETQDPRFLHVAVQHADTVLANFIRPDGSVNHIVEFDPFDGHMVKSYGGQGYGEGSSWTRGQSWALYGFTMSYIHTQNPAYLAAAKRVAHYFIANIPESGLIPVDFRQPKEPAWEDSCAAAIAASGLIEIARHVGEYERELYLRPALKLLHTLDEQRADWSDDADNILTHCTAAYHDARHHFSIIYGDYFFMEAVFKLKGGDVFLW